MHGMAVLNPLELKDLWFLFMAYSVVWIIMFGFLGRMLKKARKLDHDVRLIREQWLHMGQVVEDGQSPTPPRVPPSIHSRERGV